MSEWIVYSKDGLTERCRLKKLEYAGSYMNERTVTATFEYHSEVAFEVFDYIVYRGERFELEAIPSVKKTSKFGYTYELRFVSLKYELERCEMRDIVPNDNGVTYPSPLSFSFTGSVRYLAERIQANLDSLYGKGVWTISVASEVSNEEKNITISQQNCWNALSLVNTSYGLDFSIKGRNVTIGKKQPVVSHVFQYGKGNGLYEIERVADTGTGIVTKLRAYGSTRNLDYSYPKKPEWADSVLPVSFILSPLRLMLPSFKLDGKTDYVMANDSVVEEYGIRESSMIYEDIYPTITDVVNSNGDSIDEIMAVEEVDDSSPTFVIHLYDLGFDLESHLTTEDAQISMKSGAMQGYTFNISKIEKKADNTYKITLGRITTDSSNTGNYDIPNSQWGMSAGDKFVLLNILMPQEYIRAAEQRLLVRAQEYLAEYGKTNFSYNIGLNDKFLKEHENIYDELIEGSKLSVYDEELGIREEVTIQSITIDDYMEDNILPQVKVTLNNKPSASTLERIQGKINELSDSASNSFSTQTELLQQYRKKLDKPFFDRLFAAVDKDGKEIPSTDLSTPISYIKARFSLASLGGLTMYLDDKSFNLPTIYDGLPIDSQTIYWEDIKDDNGVVVGKVLKAKIGGGTLGSLTNVGEWADSIADVDRIMVQKKGSDTWEAMDVSEIGSASFENISESGEGNAYTSFELSEDKKFLTLVKGETFALASDLEDKWTTDEELINNWNTAFGWGNHAEAGYALQKSLDLVSEKLNNFLEGSDTDSIINKWKELEVFLGGLTESDNLAEILATKANQSALEETNRILATKWTKDDDKIANWDAAFSWGDHSKAGYAAKSYVDSTFITIAGNEDVTGVHNFVNGLKIGGKLIDKPQDDVIYIDANLVVRGGITMYGDRDANIPSILNSIPTAGYDDIQARGLIAFNSKHFVINNGVVSAIQGSAGLNEEQLDNYLKNNHYATEDWVKEYIVEINTGETVNITKQMVIDALEYTPYDASNPNGYITSATLDGYLPLTGGALTGNSDTPLVLLGATDTWIAYRDSNNTFLASIGVKSDKEPYIYHNSVSHKLWHEGNDGGGSGLDADKLDGREGSGYAYHVSGVTIVANKYIKIATLPASSESTYDNVTISGTIGGWYSYNKADLKITVGRRDGVTFKGYSYPRVEWDIYVNDNGELLIYLPSQYYAWDLSVTCNQAVFDYKVDYTPTDTNFTKMSDSSYIVWFNNNGSVASATKLQTPRTIWGQSFDGMSDITGNIILPNSSKIFIKDASNNDVCVSQIYGNDVHFGDGANSKGYVTYIGGNSIIMRYGTSSTCGFVLSEIGNVGIGGVTYPQHKLDVNGDIYSRNKVIINGISLSKSQDGVLFLDGNLVVKGGVTMYGTDSSSAPSILDSLPIASTSAKGIAQFSGDYFTVSDGIVRIIDGSVGLKESELNAILDGKNYAAKTDLSGYLPLTGGTISNADYGALIVLRKSNQGFSGIRFSNWSGVLGYLGIGGSASDFPNQPTFIDPSFNAYGLIHSGNIGSQSVNYANRAGDADTLDGKHISEISKYIYARGTAYALTADSDLNTITCGYYTSDDNVRYTNAPITNFGLLNVNINGWYRGQLLLPYNSNSFRIRYRSHVNSNGGYIWCNWRELAYIDDNVASATYATTAGNAEKFAGVDFATLVSIIPTNTNQLENGAGFITSSGYSAGVTDYYDRTSNISIGYQSSSLTASQIDYIAAYSTASGNIVIKDVDKSTMQSWLGLGSLAYKSSLVASDIPSLDWSKITSGKPTTLDGYGITDSVKTCVWINTGDTPLVNTTGFEQNIGSYISLGWSDGWKIMFRNSARGIEVRHFGNANDSGWNTLIHSGNIGNQSVNYATSAGNANTLDSKDSADFFRILGTNNNLDSFGDDSKLNGVVFIHRDMSGTSNAPFDYGTVLAINGYAGSWMLGSSDDNKLMYRNRWWSANGYGWSSWKTIAFTDSNVASATKLSDNTSYTIWGQEFFVNGKPKSVNGAFRLLREIPGTVVIHKALVYPTSPYGLITRAYIDGDISLQVQREDNDSECFNLLLNPLGGNVGIGIPNPSSKLHVDGNILATGGITMYSARILKNIVDERGLSLKELSVIKPTRYTWKDGRDSRLHFGGIADDIQQVLPEVVYKTKEGILTMDYGNAGFAIAASLIKPVVDHEEKIRQLQNRVSELEQELNRLRA